MSLTMQQARIILLANLPKDAQVLGAMEHEGKFLFLAPTSDPLEGHLDPFFSVDARTGRFRDFSPQDYDDPAHIIATLTSY